jgi:hypothetical protein
MYASEFPKRYFSTAFIIYAVSNVFHDGVLKRADGHNPNEYHPPPVDVGEKSQYKDNTHNPEGEESATYD